MCFVVKATLHFQGFQEQCFGIFEVARGFHDISKIVDRVGQIRMEFAMRLPAHRHRLLEHGHRLIQVSLVEQIQPEFLKAVGDIRMRFAEDRAPDVERLAD